jgi:hypothetical protein
MKKLFLLLFLLGISVWNTYAYTPKDVDFAILDRIEERVFDLIDAQKIEPEDFVYKLEELLENKKYSDRIEVLLWIMIEDINYTYSIGWDSEWFMMSESDCYDDEVYDTDTWVCFPKYEDDEYSDNDYGDDYGDESWYDDYDDAYYGDDYESDEEYGDDEEEYWYDDETDERYPVWYGENDDFWDEYIDEDYSNWEEENDAWDEYDSEEGYNDEEDWNDVPDEAVYSIKGDSLTLTEGKKDEKHSQIWGLFTKIIPANYRKDLNIYSVYNDEESDTMASVWQNEENIETWDISVNRAFFYDANWKLDTKETVHTLIHEFAHILTFSPSQIDYVPQNIGSDSAYYRLAAKCQTTFVFEWCLKEGSYLDEFITSFWTKSEIDGTENGDLDVYSQKPSSFVSEYAATNFGEDISETFTHFVLKGKPTGNTVADKKIQFLYQFDELVALRELIRKRVDEITAQ